MIVAAVMPWKSACGRVAQSKTWMGRTVKPSRERLRDERDEGRCADQDERRRLADGAGHGEDDAGHDAGGGGREDAAADHLPARGAERVGALALRLAARP